MSKHRIYKVAFVFVLLLLFFSIIKTQANVVSEEPIDGYLSKEDVFKAMAYTYNSSDISQYINEDYGGMYIDKQDGGLVICYTNDSDMLNINKEVFKEKPQKLLSSKDKVLVDNMRIKGVKYNYQELLEASDYLYEISEQYVSEIKSWSIDEENNRIEIELFDTAEVGKVKEEILSKFNSDMISFTFSPIDDKVENITDLI